MDIAAAQQNLTGSNGDDRPLGEAVRQNLTGNSVHGVCELRHQHRIVGEVEVHIGRCQTFPRRAGRLAVPQIQPLTLLLGNAYRMPGNGQVLHGDGSAPCVGLSGKVFLAGGRQGILGI